MIGKRQRNQPCSRDPTCNLGEHQAIAQLLTRGRAGQPEKFVPIGALQSTQPTRLVERGRFRMARRQFIPSGICERIDDVNTHRTETQPCWAYTTERSSIVVWSYTSSGSYTTT